MGKLWAILDLFRKGSAVSDPALWKNSSNLAAALGALLLAVDRVAAAYGFPLGITDSDAVAMAGGMAAAAHIVLSIVTSDKIGLPANPASDPPDRAVDGVRDLAP